MTILVLGAGGQLGTAFSRLLGANARYAHRTDLDLRDLDTIAPAIADARSDVVVNCAAYTAVDAAESDAATAGVVNGHAVGELATACSAIGARFVTYSTDYVFDGTSPTPYTEDHVPNPVNVYGRTKLDGERRALAVEGSLVIRTSWVISGTHRNFVTSILDRLAEGGASVVDDQRGCPTVAADLARATLDALAAGATGLLHLANRDAMTWFDLARSVAEIAGHDPAAIVPCRTADLGLAAARPENSELRSVRAAGLGVPLPGPLGPGLETAVRESQERSSRAERGGD